jgi:hypothetical protein
MKYLQRIWNNDTEKCMYYIDIDLSNKRTSDTTGIIVLINNVSVKFNERILVFSICDSETGKIDSISNVFDLINKNILGVNVFENHLILTPYDNMCFELYNLLRFKGEVEKPEQLYEAKTYYQLNHDKTCFAERIVCLDKGHYIFCRSDINYVYKNLHTVEGVIKNNLINHSSEDKSNRINRLLGNIDPVYVFDETAIYQDSNNPLYIDSHGNLYLGCMKKGFKGDYHKIVYNTTLKYKIKDLDRFKGLRSKILLLGGDCNG